MISIMQKKFLGIQMKKIIILNLLLMLFYACNVTTNSQRRAITDVGEASEHLGIIILSELLKLRKETIEMNRISLELKGAVRPNNLDSNFDIETVSIRIKAAKTLVNYGRLLLSLTKDNQEEKARKACKELFKNISQFNTLFSSRPYVEIIAGRYKQTVNRPFSISSLEQLENLNHSIQELGGIFQKIVFFYYHAKKFKILKKTICSYNYDIKKLCYLLMNDFSLNGKGLIRDYKNTLDILENSVSGLRFINDYSQRKAAVEGYSLILKNREKIHLFAPNIESALKAFIEANNILVIHLEENEKSDLSEINTLAINIKELTEDSIPFSYKE